MRKGTWNKLAGTLIVPIGLAVILFPYSLLIGWNCLVFIT